MILRLIDYLLVKIGLFFDSRKGMRRKIRRQKSGRQYYEVPWGLDE
jgi:hypothetical protein